MSKVMLIDAAHQEETRVVVLNNKNIEEFEYQTSKKATKGNIYLAKIMRVEPSLQAAFVDYGSQKHGFLPFSEVHPDYYQIPTADREKLMEELLSARKAKLARAQSRKKQTTENENPNEAVDEVEMPQPQPNMLDDDEDDDKLNFHTQYKIQEVLKKDQVILVQVEKEERGNKGASLTTYVSLAGRFCVFMPNATKGGGVSKKIENFEDRNRLKDIATELTAQCGNTGAVIIRTAGAYKTKVEIKRDLEYLQKLWDGIRENTVKSNAPAFILEEGDVIKKSIRDLYDSDFEQIVIAGKKAYEDAQEFMKLILPKHVNKLRLHEDKVPLLSKYNVDDKLAALYDTQVSLRSGGYIVINNTEALVSIDVNSGRSTGERNVESTAFKTNMEAAEEVARQLRLRDLSGLIVIDFIDMEEIKNRRGVERHFRECLGADRAKIQVGRISSFGLLEMSRQRLNPSFIEMNTQVCSHCNGKGRIRPVSGTSVVVLRAIHSELGGLESCEEILVSASSELVLYILNNKRTELAAIEEEYKCKVTMYVDETAGGDGFFIETKKSKPKPKAAKQAERALSISDVKMDAVVEDSAEEEIIPQMQPRGERDFRSQRGRRNKSRFKLRRGRGGHDKNSNEGFDSQGSNEPVSEQQPADFESKKPFADEGQRRNSRHRGKKHHPKKENVQVTDVNPDQFDKEMADRRKQNQSLLKEIWKKIVD